MAILLIVKKNSGEFVNAVAEAMGEGFTESIPFNAPSSHAGHFLVLLRKSEEEECL